MGVSPTDCQYEVLCPCLRLHRQRQLRGLHHRPGCPRRHLWRHHHRCGLWSRPCLWIWSHRQQGNLRLCPPRRLLRQEGCGGRARGLHNRSGRPRTPHPQRLRHWPPPQCRSLPESVTAMDCTAPTTVFTTARERLRLRPSPTTMEDMVLAILTTDTTTARGRPRLRPSPTITEDMEDMNIPVPTPMAPTDSATAEDTTGDKSSGIPSSWLN